MKKLIHGGASQIPVEEIYEGFGKEFKNDYNETFYNPTSYTQEFPISVLEENGFPPNLPLDITSYKKSLVAHNAPIVKVPHPDA